MPDNPSIVKTDEGSNYSGIKPPDSLGQSTIEYLNNLQQLAMRPAGGAMQSNQYFPSAGQDVQIGSVATKTLGSQPIFAAGTGLIPYAVMDQYAKEKKESEVAYYNNLGKDMKFLDPDISLSMPWLQDSLDQKMKDYTDGYMDVYSSRFNGDTMKAYKALSVDPDFNFGLKQFQNYAATVNYVYKEVKDIQKEANDPEGNFYVDPEMEKMMNDFLYKTSKVEELPMSALLETAKNMKVKVNSYKIAKLAANDLGERVYESFRKDIDKSTNKVDAYLKITQTGPSEEEIQQTIDLWKKKQPSLEDDPTFEGFLRSMVDNKIEVAIQTLGKEVYDGIEELRKKGFKMDVDGKAEFTEVVTGFAKQNNNTFATGQNGIAYPTSGKNEFIGGGMPGGMTGYIRDHDGTLRYIKLPTSVDYRPRAEYDLTSVQGWQGEPGRYVEGSIKVDGNTLKTRPKTTTVINKDSEGNVIGAQNVSGGANTETTTSEPSGLRVWDERSKTWVELYGEYDIITPFAFMKQSVQSFYPGIEVMHDQLPQSKLTEPRTDETIDLGDAEEIDLDEIRANSTYVWKGEKYQVKLNDKGEKVPTKVK
jgi:hypothetical protein